MEKDPEIRLVPMRHRRQGFLYVEKCVIHREDGGIIISSHTGEVLIVPATQFYAIMLGRGTTITHDAVMLAAETNLSLFWLGDGAVRYYAHGNPSSRNSKLLLRQAEMVSNRTKRLQGAKRLYQLRFPDENIESNTMQQLLGKEGTRVRKAYNETAAKYGFNWNKRAAQMDTMEDDDLLNQSITMATSALYGICHATILALGLSPGLGFIHTGLSLSFVYDLADLYKTSVAVEVGFACVQQLQNEEPTTTLDSLVRTKMREAFFKNNLTKKIVDDIKTVLNVEADLFNELDLLPDLYLWMGENQTVQSSRNYGD